MDDILKLSTPAGHKQEIDDVRRCIYTASCRLLQVETNLLPYLPPVPLLSQDDLLAELEELEQEELEKDLLEVEEPPSEPIGDTLDELPEVRK